MICNGISTITTTTTTTNKQTNKQIRSNKVRFTAVSQTVTGNNLSVGGKL